MTKDTLLICVLLYFLLSHQFAFSQSPEGNLKGKTLIGIGYNFTFAYSEDHTSRFFQYESYPKAGYFVSPKIMPFVGVNILENKLSVLDSKNGLRITAFSPGIRWYLTKKNMFFIETGMQFGRAKLSDSIQARQSFTQAGVGLGINLLLLQGIGNGRLSLEFLFRVNTVLANNGIDVPLPSKLTNLGTTFAINYILPFDPPEYKQFQYSSPARTTNIHIIKMNMPFVLTYSYERSMGKTAVMKLEFVAAEMLNIFFDERYFVPKIKVEPRYYYGYIKRQQRGQVVLNNSSDFLALELSYQWLWIKGSAEKYWQINVAPKWGLRRSISRHFIVEASVGANFNYNIEKKFRIEPFPETKVGYVF